MQWKDSNILSRRFGCIFGRNSVNIMTKYLRSKMTFTLLKGEYIVIRSIVVVCDFFQDTKTKFKKRLPDWRKARQHHYHCSCCLCACSGTTIELGRICSHSNPKRSNRDYLVPVFDFVLGMRSSLAPLPFPYPINGFRNTSDWIQAFSIIPAMFLFSFSVVLFCLFCFSFAIRHWTLGSYLVSLVALEQDTSSVRLVTTNYKDRLI